MQPIKSHSNRSAAGFDTVSDIRDETITNENINSQRFIQLDALRGFAVMGIVMMNIVTFAFPQNAYFSPLIYGGTAPADIMTWFLSFVFFDGKMRGLFSLLFGASMMLIIMRSEAKGENSAKSHYNRMIWLIIFGLLHFSLIWFGDILFLYGIVGCFAYLMHHMDSKALIKSALGIFVTFALLLSIGLGSIFFVQNTAKQDGATVQEIAEYDNITSEFNPDSQILQDEIILHKSSYVEIVKNRITEQWTTPLFSLIIGITETFPFMLIGMALLKNGFLLGQSRPHIYKRGIKWGLGGGTILYAALGGMTIISGFDIVVALNAHQAWSALPRLMMTIGYAAAFITIIQNFQNSRGIIRIAAVGRMAFTNYIGSSIIMTSIFYGYGLGLFAEVSRSQLPFFVFSLWGFMLLWSKPWLIRFQYGPLEWLWRSLARRTIQPFKRKEYSI